MKSDLNSGGKKSKRKCRKKANAKVCSKKTVHAVRQEHKNKNKNKTECECECECECRKNT